MPTDQEREYYRLGFADGLRVGRGGDVQYGIPTKPSLGDFMAKGGARPKRKLSAWNKFVKANSKKKIYKYANGKLKLKKMGIAFRKKKK